MTRRGTRLPALTLALSLLVACSGQPRAGATPAREADDVVSMASTRPVTVLLDGRRAACANDERVSGTGSIPVGNILTPGSCPSELAAFAESHAMHLLAPLAAWTDAGGDVVSISMTSLLDVPLAVWIMHQNRSNTRAAEVEVEVNRAAQLYDTGQCGVEFTAAVSDVSRRSFPSDLLGAGCDRLADFKAVGFQAGRVNVYYTRTANGFQGLQCPDGNSDILLIGATINDSETLAHELGHALSWGHWNTTQGNGGDNLMLSPGSFRNSLSLGQCFRANANSGSVLNRLSVRTGPTRDCPDGVATASCPALAIK